MKKLLCIISSTMFLTLTALNSYSVFADDAIKVYVDGSAVSFDDQEPIIENGRTLVPFRAVLNKMGAKVEWESDTKTIICTNGDIIVKLTVDSNEIIIGEDKTIELDVAAKIENGRTLVPLRAISESLGANVNWNAQNKIITIDTQTVSNQSVKSETYSDSIKADDGTVVCFTEMEYPVLNGSGKFIDKINQDYSAYIQNLNETFLTEYGDEAKAFYADNNFEEFNGWSELINGEVTYHDNEKVCILTEISVYTGGAHPNSYKEAVIYDINSGNKLNLEDICENKDEVIEKATAGFKEMIEKAPIEYYEDALETLDVNNAVYYLTDDGITFSFGKYEIAPYARGYVEYSVK